MWPKAFAQLVELAPHISRLLPMADRFFQNKSAAEDANRKAIETMGDRLRSDLHEINLAQTGLSDQLADLSRKVSTSTTDAQAFKTSADALDRRLTHIETRQSRLSSLLLFVLVLLVIVLALLVFIAARGR